MIFAYLQQIVESEELYLCLHHFDAPPDSHRETACEIITYAS